MFHKVKNVFPLDDYKLLVQFCVGVTKIYGVKPLFKWKDIFKTLIENELFYGVYVDVGGFVNESTLRKAISYGKFKNGIDVCKYGKQWIVSIEAMNREYGQPK